MTLLCERVRHFKVYDVIIFKVAAVGDIFSAVRLAALDTFSLGFYYILCIKLLFFTNIIFLILAFVDSFPSFLGTSSLRLLTNVLSTEKPVALHWSVVCVRGQHLAFTNRPRRFRLTAVVALAMCGWETGYLFHSISLTESIAASH